MQFAVMKIQPDLGGCYIQVSDATLSPTVGSFGGVTTSMAHRLKPFVGHDFD
jgi:hypothetical protein